MHYDIQQAWSERPQGGDLVVELQPGDTATNFASTKGPIFGPAVVVYQIDRTGISEHVFASRADLPTDFVRDAVRPGEIVWLT